MRETLWLVVVERARQRWYSEGVTLTELAEILQGLGAYNAINLDGGGSSTMVIGTGNGVRKRSMLLSIPVSPCVNALSPTTSGFASSVEKQ